ncbi:3-isopropylmalate dehydrogenase [Siccirubricoccus sp. KC 17139]|uniref:3-isopropylmalate dehydrogenase n=1 Tax=Siccirubricoccus soli TaxID=2899147 RepID=A0ABT1D7A1_9PROT|nr:3-isopropylmalate dehydrogenase [Siccirubricoccus soli]MCO6417815.1 3-isopropylmalate dehydrogenase [Siccirubricoccus soli]MCP2683950.1 3-isopropylmalate dehydrogenase [Siccirubricoccus soli]
MKIAVLAGDGIGPEVTAQAVKALRAISANNGPQFEMAEAPIGDAAFNQHGDPLPPSTAEMAAKADAILFGAAGTYESDLRPAEQRGGHGLLRLRKQLDLYANFRPVFAFPELLGASSLKREAIEGVDLVVLRELTSDIYFGTPRGRGVENGQRHAWNTMRYTEAEVARVMRAGFEAARKRRRQLCSVDKANVLETSQLWREVAIEVARDYPDVELRHEYVDAVSMHLIRRPRDFDVIVTGNIFGDILSDAAAMLTGSIGMLPSASLNGEGVGLFEPVHGSAPDIAGKDLANPLASILSAALLLRHSLKLEAEAALMEKAVRQVLAEGYRTGDIMEEGATRLGTEAMGDAVAQAILKLKG